MANDDLTREILSKLDILTEYAELGVNIAGMPRDSGSAECFAYGRNDEKPSAWINVETGRYGDSGTNENYSLWEFCTHFFPERFPTWIAARNHFAEKVGIEPPKRGRPPKAGGSGGSSDGSTSPAGFTSPAGSGSNSSPTSPRLTPSKSKAAAALLEQVGFFEEWNQGNLRLAHTWCSLYKVGVTVQALLDCGARVAYWSCFRDKSTGELRRGDQKVIALPCYSPALDLDAPTPTAWVIYNLAGPKLRKYNGNQREATWEKMLSIGPTAGTLMNLSALRKLKEVGEKGGDYTVWKTGGPSDMLTLLSKLPADADDPAHGTHLVVTNASGEGGDVAPDQASVLAGQRVRIVHDADETGELGAMKWLRGTVACSPDVRHVRLPYLIEPKHGKDLRDWLTTDGKGFADLLAIAEATPRSLPETVSPAGKGKSLLATNPPANPQPAAAGPAGSGEASASHHTPSDPVAEGDSDPSESSPQAEAAGIPLSPTDQEEAICRIIGIEVLGELESGAIEIYSLSHRKMYLLLDINRLSHDKLLQIGGPMARDNVTAAKVAAPPYLLTFDQVRPAIATLAGYRRIDESTKKGAGCWQGVEVEVVPGDTDPNSNPAAAGSSESPAGPSVICVGAGGAVEWTPATRRLRPIHTPRYHGRILDFASGEKWFDHADLSARLSNPDPTWTHRTYDSLVEVLSRWRWKQPDGAEIAASMVFATWMQTLWTWRPQVGITGASSAGKSKLFEFLSGLFGPLAAKSAGSSPAGLRQLMRISSRALFCDEFENSRYRQEILEMLRLAGRGEKVLRGTTHHRVEEFILCCIAWVAAIEIALKREPDANRFIMLELLKPKVDQQNKLALPTPAETLELGQQTLAASILHINRAKSLASALRTTRVAGVSPRVIESYSVPVAMRAAVRGEDEESARQWLVRVTSGLGQDVSTTPDEVDLLGKILSTAVNIGRGETKGVAEILLGSESAHKECLARLGVEFWRHVEKDADGRSVEVKRMFVANCTVDKLLWNTRWKDQSIEQILRRIPGTIYIRHRMAGVQLAGVGIKYDYLVESELLQAEGADGVQDEF